MAPSEHIPWYYLGYHLERFFRWAFSMPYVRPEDRYVAEGEEDSVRVTDPDGKTAHVAWSRLARVYIRTTSDGPWNPDVFLCLEDASGTTAEVPNGNAAYSQLFSRAAGLPGFEGERALAASFCTDDRVFVVWEMATD